MICINIESSNNSNNLALSSVESVKSQERLDVSGVKGKISSVVNGLEGSSGGPVVSKSQIVFESFDSNVVIQFSKVMLDIGNSYLSKRLASSFSTSAGSLSYLPIL